MISIYMDLMGPVLCKGHDWHVLYQHSTRIYWLCEEIASIIQLSPLSGFLWSNLYIYGLNIPEGVNKKLNTRLKPIEAL